MKLTITQKAFLVVMVITITAVSVTFGLIFGSVSSGIESFIRARESAALEPALKIIKSEYERHGSWDFLAMGPLRFRHNMNRSIGGPPRLGPPPGHSPPEHSLSSDRPVPLPAPGHGPGHGPGYGPSFGGFNRLARQQSAMLSRICLFNQKREQIFGLRNQELGIEEFPIKIGNEQVGYLRLIEVPIETNGIEKQFVEKLRENVLTIGGLILVSSFGAAILLSKVVVQPLKQIEDGLKKISDGDFSTRVQLNRNDELGDLSTEVNQLAVSLSKHEQSRMQWMADTSHELRTPIAIMRAQIEAFQDGVQKVNAKTLGVIHSEIMSLNRLVNQLYDLSRADLGRLSLRFSSFNPIGLVGECIESFEARYEDKNVSIETELAEDGHLSVQCDADMLKQVFSNLLENSLRYTDEGGTLKVTTLCEKGNLYIRFDDTAPGVPQEHYDKLFERFFRVDSSRSRLLGGTGLGLSICKHIMESHAGGISASESPLGGLRIEMWLPLEGRSSNG